MSVAELQQGFLKLVKTLYSAEETEARRRGFRQRLRNSRKSSPDITRREEVLAA